MGRGCESGSSGGWAAARTHRRAASPFCCAVCRTQVVTTPSCLRSPRHLSPSLALHLPRPCQVWKVDCSRPVLWCLRKNENGTSKTKVVLREGSPRSFDWYPFCLQYPTGRLFQHFARELAHPDRSRSPALTHDRSSHLVVSSLGVVSHWSITKNSAVSAENSEW